MMLKRWQAFDGKGNYLEERYDSIKDVVERSFWFTPKLLETSQQILLLRCILSLCSGGPSPSSSQRLLPIYLLT